ncbi:hypothetical protein GCM10027051_16690 [Niabella terrae]
MRKIGRLLFYLLLLSANLTEGLGQRPLSESPDREGMVRVYQLTDHQTEQFMKYPDRIKDDFFQHLVAQYSENNRPILPFGNYLRVWVVKNKVNYILEACNNVNLNFVNNQRDFQFLVTDLEGKRLPNLRIMNASGKRVSFDELAQLYRSAYPRKDSYLKVVYQGVSNYFTYEVEDRAYRRREKRYGRRSSGGFPLRQIRSAFRPLIPGPSDRSFMVFSKPQYKPGDTVKFKAWLLHKDGRRIRSRRASLVVRTGSGHKTLRTLTAYRPGFYEGQFVITDSLGLRLDADYHLLLVDSGYRRGRPMVSGRFRFEAYTLEGLRLSLHTDKIRHGPGDTVRVFMKATDENDLTLTDGRVAILIRSLGVSKFYADSVFVKDSLWFREQPLDPEGTTQLCLPDSIFPAVRMDYRLQVRLLSSSNETISEERTLTYDAAQGPGLLEARFIKDSLLLHYRQGDRERRMNVQVVREFGETDRSDTVTVQLPARLVADYSTPYYKVLFEDGSDTTVCLYDFEPELRQAARQEAAQLHLMVQNTHKIPFWYTIFSANKVLARGYTTTLDTLIRHREGRVAYFRINYFWDEEERTAEITSSYSDRRLELQLLAPDQIYPGQALKMKLRVKDSRGRPVPGVDITAYAQTDKLKASPVPVPLFGRMVHRTKSRPFHFESETLYENSQQRLDWQRWGRQLGLDTIEYYRFTHPESLYTITETATDSLTQFAVFVMKEGDFEPVNLLYLDELPVFYYAASQLQRYVFPVTPGKHSLRIRTPDHEITLSDLEFRPHVKTILSIAADTSNRRAKVVRQKAVLRPEESQRLARYMIQIRDNFGQRPAFIKDDTTRLWLNPSVVSLRQGRDLLIGPLRSTGLQFRTVGIQTNFVKEPGYRYLFTPGLLKQQSVRRNYVFDTVLSRSSPYAERYKDQLLKDFDYDSIFNEFLNIRSRTTNLFWPYTVSKQSFGQLRFAIDTAFTRRLPYIKNIIISDQDAPHRLLILKGNETAPQSLPAGRYTLLFLLRDNRYFRARNIEVFNHGLNYYHWRDFEIYPPDSFSRQLDAGIKTGRISENNQPPPPRELVRQFNQANLDTTAFHTELRGRLIDAENGAPVAGGTVSIEGTNGAAVTDSSGYFRLRAPARGRLVFSAIGYQGKIVPVEGFSEIIELDRLTNGLLEEVVVTGLGISRRASLTAASVQISDQNFAGMLQGKVAGLIIRGASVRQAPEKPLIMVDGIPFDGDVDQLDMDAITETRIFGAADATAIYGAAGANGVIIIKTKNGNSKRGESGALEAGAATLRSRFSDEGFWMPALTTDENGEVSFTARFPDDITSWRTRVIAVSNRKKTGMLQTHIRSFRTLSAQLATPQFAIEGDRISVIGKLMNYTPFPEMLRRRLSCNQELLLLDSLPISHSHIDTSFIQVKGTDSLQLEYSLEQDNGYFDGERRQVPVYAAGVQETRGRFMYMGADTDSVFSYRFDSSLGPGTLRAAASVFPVLLDEILRLRDYAYDCNEQLASKLKALLLEEKLRAFLKEPFHERRRIPALIKKLETRKSINGLWGWWQGASSDPWISLHVIEALLKAEAAGYPGFLDRRILEVYLREQTIEKGVDADERMIRLRALLEGPGFLKDWVRMKEASLPDQPEPATLFQWLQLQELRQLAGLPVNTDTILTLKKQTAFGANYWGQESYRFWDNSIQNTLLVYRILQKAGGQERVLSGIRRYFLEQRREGQWRNTYESSLILETILPDMIRNGNKPRPAELLVNGTPVTQFPLVQTWPAGDTITITRSGDMPVYLTAYQQFHNPAPQESSKSFALKTNFVRNGGIVRELAVGKPVTLQVTLEVKADADYVMIEVPIPAGCTYANKSQTVASVETHREYFYHKTAIFCRSLRQGSYKFDIQLFTRYQGDYQLNPAKAELMYFPVFSGRTGLRRISIGAE